MNRLGIFAMTAAAFLMVGTNLPSGKAQEPRMEQQKIDVDAVNAAGKQFIAAIAARDIEAMDKLWSHNANATFIGPLSTIVVVGWDGVRKAWEMRFGQFDRVTISLAESHVRTQGSVAWVVGVERVQLLRKDGKTLGFDAFVTNVLEKKDGRWLMVSHQATPVFRPPNQVGE